MGLPPSPPDLVEPVVGFRAWKVIGERLLSPYIPVRWEGPVMHAACLPANRRLLFGRGWLAERHCSPHPDCQCGIYAYHRPGAQAYYGEFDWLGGILSAWGRVEVHATGIRAEHARVEALALAPCDQRRRRLAVAVAARLGVALVEEDALSVAAAEFGRPLPPSLLPS